MKVNQSRKTLTFRAAERLVLLQEVLSVQPRVAVLAGK